MGTSFLRCFLAGIPSRLLFKIKWQFLAIIQYPVSIVLTFIASCKLNYKPDIRFQCMSGHQTVSPRERVGSGHQTVSPRERVGSGHQTVSPRERVGSGDETNPATTGPDLGQTSEIASYVNHHANRVCNVPLLALSFLLLG